MPTVILITGHYLHSKRRAGFHWIAHALHQQGWRVIMMTTPISWLSWLRRDHRMQYDVRKEAGRLIWSDDRLGSYVAWTPVHPVSLKYKFLNHAVRPVFARFEKQPLGAIESEISTADCFIFESTAALTLIERFQKLNTNARMVYRVSDDLNTLRVHPSLHDHEKRIAPLFDRISSPTQTIHDKFVHFPAAHLDCHGVATPLFDQCETSPYDESDQRHAVFVGVARLDYWYLDVVSRARRDINFHIIGPFEAKLRRSNVIFHGEMPFEQTVPFLKFADVGLQTITGGPGAESFADSLKMQQYSWCRLPIIAPEFINSVRDNVVSYTPGSDLSAVQSIDRALKLNRQDDWQIGLRSWDEVARALVGDDSLEQPPVTIETFGDQERASNLS